MKNMDIVALGTTREDQAVHLVITLPVMVSSKFKPVFVGHPYGKVWI
jgi:hypothetical protein